MVAFNRKRSAGVSTRRGILYRAAVETLESRQYLSSYFVATNGSDNAAGDAAHPWATLQHAANTAEAGDNVDVAAGTYSGFQETTSGKAGAPITFHAESGVLINNDNSATDDGIDLERASYITIDGFNVEPASGVTMRAGIRSVANTNTIISNNTVTAATSWGIFTGFSENLLIENNTVSNIQQQHGIYVSNSADNPHIIDNISYNNPRCGIQINSDGSLTDSSLPAAQGSDGIITGALVEGNILYNNANSQAAGINLDGVQDSIVENNLIYDTQRNGIALYKLDGSASPKNNTIVNNTIVMNSASAKGYAAISALDGATGTKIENNILSAAESSMSIDSSSLSGLQSDYNVFGSAGIDPTGNSYANNVALAKWQAMGYDQHSINVSNIDALFVNATAGNFHLATNSAALGTASAAQAPATDLTGSTRPSTGPVDAGAYQSGSSTTTPPPVVAAPSAPINLGSASQTTSQISLTWNTGGGNVTGYEILRKTGNNAFAQVGTTTSASFTDSGLNDSTSYTYEIIATGPGGNSSASSALSVATKTPVINPPSAPISLASSAQTTSQISLNWNTGGGNVTGYEIFAKSGNGAFSQIGTTNGATNFTATGLTASTAYTFEMIATGPGGSSAASSAFTVSTAAAAVVAPNSPTDLTSSSQTTSQIVLNWNNGGGNVSGYEILRKTGSVPYTQIGTTTGATTYTDVGLSDSTQYTYEIIATGAGGASNVSSALTVSTDAVVTPPPVVVTPPPVVVTPPPVVVTPPPVVVTPPPIVVTVPVLPPTSPVGLLAPTNVVATANGTSEIDLAWTESSSSITGYQIEEQQSDGSYATIATTDGTAKQFAVSGLNANTNYTFEIVAMNQADQSTASDSASAQTVAPASHWAHFPAWHHMYWHHIAWNHNADNSTVSSNTVMASNSSAASFSSCTQFLSPGDF